MACGAATLALGLSLRCPASALFTPRGYAGLHSARQQLGKGRAPARARATAQAKRALKRPTARCRTTTEAWGAFQRFYGGVRVPNRETRELKFGKTGLLRGGRTARTSPHHAEVAGRATLGINTLSASGDGRTADGRSTAP